MRKFSQTLTDESDWINEWVELKNFSIPLISSCTIYYKPKGKLKETEVTRTSILQAIIWQISTS